MPNKLAKPAEGEPFTLRRGEFVKIGRRLYGVCADCNGLIWVNKPLLGSVHVCEVDRG